MPAEAQNAALMLGRFSVSAAGYRSCAMPVHVRAGDEHLAVNLAVPVAGSRPYRAPLAKPATPQAISELHAAA
jgi:hypothetical protein